MRDLNNWINSKIRILLNKKMCPGCYKPYSEKTIKCSIIPAMKWKSSILFSDDIDIPVFTRLDSKLDSDARTVVTKTSVRVCEPAFTLNMQCSCGASSSIVIPVNNPA